MLKLEIKNINAKSVFKSFLMASAIPAIIVLVIMIVVVAVTLASPYDNPGNNSGSGGLLLTIGYLLLYPILFGLLGILFAFSYNWLAKKFGGLRITCSESVVDSTLDSETKNRMKLLERSFKEGILTEEEYNNKRRELVKQ